MVPVLFKNTVAVVLMLLAMVNAPELIVIFPEAATPAVAGNAPASPIAYSARTRSGWLSTSQREPLSQPASSSATPAKIRSRVSFTPSSFKRRTTSADMTAMCFMSIAPRPHK